MDIINFITEKKFSYHRIRTVIILMISTTTGMMTFTTFFIDYFNHPWLFFSIWGLLILIILSTWVYNRTVFPKGSNEKVNLIIAITTEDESQKIRITKDTAEQISRLLNKYGFSHRYTVTVLHNHLSKKLSEIIRLCVESKKAGLNDSEDIRKFNRVCKQMRAKFIVFGDLIKRDSPNGKYLLSIEALIKHNSPTKDQGKILHDEFNQLWSNEIQILESDELNGFRSNAEHIFFTASYMLGLATFVDNQFLEGSKIWEQLEKYILKKDDLKSQLYKINQLKLISYYLQSTLDYSLGNIKRSIEFREKVLAITPNNYESHLIQSIKEVTLKNRPRLAMHHIEKAKELSKGDGTWKYNKLYLEIKANQESEALKTLDDILNNSFEQEIDVVNQVIAYNRYCLTKDSDHIQTHFIIGTFLYKKLSTPVLAYEALEKFIESSQINQKFNKLKQRAKNYIDEINSILEIK